MTVTVVVLAYTSGLLTVAYLLWLAVLILTLRTPDRRRRPRWELPPAAVLLGAVNVALAALTGQLWWWLIAGGWFLLAAVGVATNLYLARVDRYIAAVRASTTTHPDWDSYLAQRPAPVRRTLEPPR